jgi:hypothetical protein
LGSVSTFSRVGWSQYKKRSDPGIALAGHEVRHTIDQGRMGLPSYISRYLWQLARNGFVSEGIPLERGAEADYETILQMLEQTGIGDSIRDDTYGRVIQPANPMTNVDLLENFGLLYDYRGTLFIEGVDVTGVFREPDRAR